MDWSYEFGDPRSTRINISLDFRSWLIGVAWSGQDICFRLPFIIIDFDWFEP
jgi:hypothetical protein